MELDKEERRLTFYLVHKGLKAIKEGMTPAETDLNEKLIVRFTTLKDKWGSGWDK